MDEGLVFKVIQKDGITYCVNHSEHKLYLILKPIKPKRKYKNVFVIESQSFLIFDKNVILDLTDFVFSLEKV